MVKFNVDLPQRTKKLTRLSKTVAMDASFFIFFDFHKSNSEKPARVEFHTILGHLTGCQSKKNW